MPQEMIPFIDADGNLRYIKPVVRDAMSSVLGIIATSASFQITPATLVPTPGTVYGAAIWLLKDTVISGVILNVGTVALGAQPTGIFVGLSDAAEMKAQSTANLAGSAQWITANGMAVIPLTTPYKVAQDGLHYPLFLQVGAWGTTQLALSRANNVGAVQPVGGSTFMYATFGTGLTALPANGTPVVPSSTGAANVLVGVI